MKKRSERQVQRLKRRFQPNSVAWVRHGNCGQSKPWAVAPQLRQRVLELARGKYAGFNDSHLRQKLVEDEGLSLSRETVRRILRYAKRPSPQKRRSRLYRARRPRRPRFGMMLQGDGSRHDWLQGRGPCSLCSASPTTPPAVSPPPAFNSNPKTPSATSAACTP